MLHEDNLVNPNFQIVANEREIAPFRNTQGNDLVFIFCFHFLSCTKTGMTTVYGEKSHPRSNLEYAKLLGRLSPGMSRMDILLCVHVRSHEKQDCPGQCRQSLSFEP